LVSQSWHAFVDDSVYSTKIEKLNCKRQRISGDKDSKEPVQVTSIRMVLVVIKKSRIHGSFSSMLKMSLFIKENVGRSAKEGYVPLQPQASS
jgi:protein Lines